MRITTLLVLAFARSVSGFVLPGENSFAVTLQARNSDNHAKEPVEMIQHAGIERRSLFNAAGALVAGTLFVPLAHADDKAKVVVMGGAGYVGSRVSAALYDQGFDVVSVSRSTSADQAAKIKANTGKSLPIQYESLDATKDDLSSVMSGAAVVISCVGIPPWEKSTARAGNGLANMRIADAAKTAGVDKFVYVSVATEFSGGPGKFLFGEYFKGKSEAEATVAKDFGDKAVFIKPGFIDGAPPGEIRPPGPPGLAAISPEAVANAVVAGVLGQAKGSLDGYDAIMAIAK